MKRFWAFHGETYYPDGGCGDTHASFDTAGEACRWLCAELKIDLATGARDVRHQSNWAHVWDMELDGEVVTQLGCADAEWRNIVTVANETAVCATCGGAAKVRRTGPAIFNGSDPCPICAATPTPGRQP